jgi:hypothetical protein
MAAIDNAIREFSALAKQQDTKFATATAPPPGGLSSLVMTYQIGTPVLDLVTGLQGVVVDGKRENVIIPPAPEPGN